MYQSEFETRKKIKGWTRTTILPVVVCKFQAFLLNPIKKKNKRKLVSCNHGPICNVILLSLPLKLTGGPCFPAGPGGPGWPYILKRSTHSFSWQCTTHICSTNILMAKAVVKLFRSLWECVCVYLHRVRELSWIAREKLISSWSSGLSKGHLW